MHPPTATPGLDQKTAEDAIEAFTQGLGRKGATTEDLMRIGLEIAYGAFRAHGDALTASLQDMAARLAEHQRSPLILPQSLGGEHGR